MHAGTKPLVSVTANGPSIRVTTSRQPSESPSRGGSLIDGPGKTSARKTPTRWVGGFPGARSAAVGI
jgi:hypothetical protein